MVVLILALIAIWVVLGVVGFVIKGLFWLFVIACVLFVLTVAADGFRRGRGSRRVR